MASISEGRRTGEFLFSEAPGCRSRDNVTVLSGQNLKAGAVVGRVDRGVGRAAIPAVVGTGNGLMSALYAGPDVELGNYVVKCTAAAANGGTFSVTTPSGKVLPSATVGTAYRSRHLNFLISDGAADFIVGDTFTVAVAASAPTVVGTGNGTISSLSLGREAKTGRYRVECVATATNGGTFEITGPDGAKLGQKAISGGAGGTAVFSDHPHLNCTITDGGTDFALGDFFEVFVYNERTKKVVAFDPSPTSYDGRHIAVGVLWDNVDASSADKPGAIIARDAEVTKAELVFDSSVPTGEQATALAQLEALGIVAR
jgi:hypothetical protein